MLKGNVRVVVLLAVAVVIGFFVSVAVAGAAVQCPPDPTFRLKFVAVPISENVFEELVEKGAASFTSEDTLHSNLLVTVTLTLKDSQVRILQLKPKDTTSPKKTPATYMGVFALVQQRVVGETQPNEPECLLVSIPYSAKWAPKGKRVEPPPPPPIATR